MSSWHSFLPERTLDFETNFECTNFECSINLEIQRIQSLMHISSYLVIILLSFVFLSADFLFSWACSHLRPHCSGCPFPSPHLKGAGIRDSRPGLSARFECCSRQHPGHGGHFGKPIQEGVPGLQGDPNAKPPPASRFQSSGATVTSQPWIQLTGGYARCVC